MPVSEIQLPDLLSTRDYGRNDKLMICLAVDPQTPQEVKAIRSLAVAAGLGAARKWNISAILGASKGLVVRVTGGWRLTTAGRKRVSELVGPLGTFTTTSVATSLRSQLPAITDVRSREFLEEAIECLENGLLRAAVVLTWVGAVSVLHKEVVSSHLSEFNGEASRRDSKWRPAKNADDLGRMKEIDFLNILERLSIIGKNVKQELEGCLRLRNSCGHPNSLKIGQSRVSSHVEILLLNVFRKFGA